MLLCNTYMVTLYTSGIYYHIYYVYEYSIHMVYIILVSTKYIRYDTIHNIIK